MQPVHVFFFRGLSTYGHDHVKWFVFDFGPVFRHLGRALSSRGLDFHPVLGMGSGSLVEVAARARAFVESHPAWQNPTARVHFLGHSAGGLVARLVLEGLGEAAREKVESCLTVATPHRGARLARICVDMPERYPGSALALRRFSYDIASRKHFFDELTSENVARLFGAGEPVPPTGIKAASIVCHAPRANWCTPLRLAYRLKAFQDFDEPSDGVIERDTQPFGEVIAEISIDHFRQVGLFGRVAEFEQLSDTISRYFISAR